MLMTGKHFAVAILVVAGALVQREPSLAATSSPVSSGMPVFEVDTTWPKLPNNWVMGIVSSVSVDGQDHVWLLHRPTTVPDELKSRAAPAVLEFDPEGKMVNAWDGEAPGMDWPLQPHGIAVDHDNNVWITGAGYAATPRLRSDDMLLKIDPKGKLLLQIGGSTKNGGNADTKNLNRSADVAFDPKTNEAFVADGYGNRRVIVFDAETGAFKRLWGGFGNKPEDGPQGLYSGSAPPPAAGSPPRTGQQSRPELDTEGPGSPQFNSPVHGIKLSKDGLVYVAGRSDRRVQVFTPDGKYVTQVFINRAGPSGQSAAGLAFSPDAAQQFLYVADFGNSRIVVLDRKTLAVLYQFGTRGKTPGDFQGLHHLAADSKGNLYTTEVSPGNRAQKFLFKGLSPTPPPNALTPAQLSPQK
jgi:DNA-binding beta-propeller fold protein YncE